METWAKQLEDALPNASQDVLNNIMDEFCPYDVFANEFAPEFISSEPCDGEQCAECWDSCDSKCRYREVSRMDENEICAECSAYGKDEKISMETKIDELANLCAECSSLGDDYYINDKGELVCACDECWIYRSMRDEEDEKDDKG